MLKLGDYEKDVKRKYIIKSSEIKHSRHVNKRVK